MSQEARQIAARSETSRMGPTDTAMRRRTALRSTGDQRVRALSHAHREALERGDRREAFILVDVYFVIVGLEQP